MAKVKAEKSEGADKPTRVKAEKDSPDREKAAKKPAGKTLDAFFSRPAEKKKPAKLTVDTSDEESVAALSLSEEEASMEESPVERRDKPARAAARPVRYDFVASEGSQEESDSEAEEGSKRARSGKKKLDDTFGSEDVEEIDLDGSDVSKPKKVSDERVFRGRFLLSYRSLSIVISINFYCHINKFLLSI